MLEPIEFFRFGKVTQVTCMQDEIWRSGQCVDLRDRFLQRADDIFIGFLVKTDVAVADLHEGEIPADQRSGRAEQF